MARYIDADTLIAHLKDEIEGCKPPFCGRANGKSIAYGTILGLKSAISFAETLSTADVVPKSEVERLQKVLDEYEETSGLKQAKAEVAREIFEEIDVMFQKYYNKCSEPTELKLLEPLCQAERFIINEMWHDVSELKKKYTEATDEV